MRKYGIEDSAFSAFEGQYEILRVNDEDHRVKSESCPTAQDLAEDWPSPAEESCRWES